MDIETNAETFREYCLSFEGVTEKMPFGKFAKRYDSILAFYVAGHMFCFIDINDFSFVNVKSTPEETEDLHARYSSTDKPINRSLRHWIQLNFNGDIPMELIYGYVKRAYNIVKAQYSKANGKQSTISIRGNAKKT